MSKYNALWSYIQKSGLSRLTLTFDEIGQITDVRTAGSLFFEIQKGVVQLWLRG